MKSMIDNDPIFRVADSFVNLTNCHVFLTGKAGSGKTTFLQYITNNSSKKNVVVAPTGVAAINAGGMTIHSFFQLPIGIFIPETRLQGFRDFDNAVFPQSVLLRKIRINKQKRKLIQQLELLIIDEVSMVRADMMDAVDLVLKQVRRNYDQPFGGVQVLMIGDLYQLPPVVTERDKTWLSRYYDSPYFFSAGVIRKSPPVCLELQTIYRQQEKKFINLLNRIRHDQVTEEDLKSLNEYYDPDFKAPSSEKYITLCSHHYKANAINDYELNRLPGKLHRFDAEIEGNFSESAVPAEQMLLLKKGAQIMFIKNDTGDKKRYYNGKIGVISEIDEEEIEVTFPEEDNTVFLEKEIWKNIRYTLDETSGNISEKELGSFCQFPIRLAWAITIHKSQGLTFDRAIIDAGDSFTSGQVYVALSRIRNMQGLVLRSPIERKSIMNDWKAGLHEKFLNRKELMELLHAEQKNYLRKILLKSMVWNSLILPLQEFIGEYREKQVSYRDDALQLGNDLLNKTREFSKVGEKFGTQLKRLFEEGEKAYPRLADRMEAAFEYFNKRLKNDIRDLLNEHYQQMKGKPRIRKYLVILQTLLRAEALRLYEIRQARDLSAGLARGEQIGGLLGRANRESKKFESESEKMQKIPRSEKGDSQKLSYEMYRQGKSIEEIARERMLQKATIESHLLRYIRKGDLEVYALISEEKYDQLVSKLEKKSFNSLSEIKYTMGDQFSYNEIKAALNFLEFKKNNSG
jgi:hypothetical protein